MQFEMTKSGEITMTKRETNGESESRMDTKLVFSNEASFHEAFPEIEDLLITVTETQGEVVFDRTKLSLQNTRIYGTNVGEHIDCHSPFCVKGGFSIREILAAMIRIREQSKQGTILCKGAEGAIERNRRCLPCNHGFHFKIVVKYRNDTARSLGFDAYQTRYNSHENKPKEVSWFKPSSTQ